MQTDPELTRALAGLMGWRVYTDYTDWRIHCLELRGEEIAACYLGPLSHEIEIWRGGFCPWRPLASMDDAMMIMQRLRELGCGTITLCLPDDAQPTVAIWLSSVDVAGGHTPDAHGNYVRTAYADTPHRAIALAALRVAGVEVEL